MMEAQTPCEHRLTDLLIYPTSRCNLKCRHCYFAPTYDEAIGTRDDEVSYEQICRAIDELIPFGLRTCKLSGGEPFLRDDLVALCRYMDQKELNINIETNGTLVTEETADILGHLPHARFIGVSIDGPDAATHDALRGVDGCFYRALQGLEYLVKAGMNVQVIAAAYQRNKGQLAETMQLAAEKGANSFKVCFIHPVGRARTLPLIDLKETLELDRQLSVIAPSQGIRYCSSVPVALKSLTHIMRTCALNGRCSITSTLAILADGTVSVCGMGRYTKDFRFGKLGQDNLTELWRSHPGLTTIREGVPNRLQGVCGRCILRSACLGHCRLENERVTLETLFDPYPKCVTAEKLGLFPESRLVVRSEPDAAAVA